MLFCNGVGKGEEICRFTLDGEPFQPKIHYVRGTPHLSDASDVIFVDGFAMRLGEEREQHFVKGKSGLSQVFPDQTERIVAVRLDGKPTNANPKEARSVKVSDWNDVNLAWLEQVNVDEVCLTIQGQPPFSEIPTNLARLKYLFLIDTSLKPFRQLHRIECLSIGRDSLNCDELWPLENLLRLQIAARQLDRTDSLTRFASIAHLDIFRSSITDIAFAEKLTSLKTVSVAQTGLRSIDALAKLPRLEVVDISHTEVASLPVEGFPSIQRLNVFGTPFLEESEALQFLHYHPFCDVVYRIRDAFECAVRGVDCVRLKIPTNRGVKLIHEETDPQRIGQILSGIEFEEPEDRDLFSSCLCSGYAIIEFYRGDELLLRLTNQHGLRLRPSAWSGDSDLTPRSQDWLEKWLGGFGVESKDT